MEKLQNIEQIVSSDIVPHRDRNCENPPKFFGHKAVMTEKRRRCDLLVAQGGPDVKSGGTLGYGYELKNRPW
ncbi:MAG: hypothetical protein JW798_15340 [Prolixibacteraceae bacterium]|nr:hypothetical protein [Prolixibacteraceae bacterium]